MTTDEKNLKVSEIDPITAIIEEIKASVVNRFEKFEERLSEYITDDGEKAYKTINTKRNEYKNTKYPHSGAGKLPNGRDKNKNTAYDIVAQGDSWFDYPLHKDIIAWLEHSFSYKIYNIAMHGSCLNDIAYCKGFSYHYDLPKHHDISRMDELIELIQDVKPQVLLLSGGGNDIAGREFFSFLNNKIEVTAKTIGCINTAVLDCVISETFLHAYIHIIEAIKHTTQYESDKPLHVFIHGYDYPWPDGRGVSILNLIGPWFDEVFTQKNYIYEPLKCNDKDAKNQLKERWDILKVFIDKFNNMLIRLEKLYRSDSVIVHHVDLRRIIINHSDWSNELHPTEEGFLKLAKQFDTIINNTIIKTVPKIQDGLE